MRQRLTRRAFALCNFVFVVRELQVGTSAMNIKRGAQHLAAHGRALDVPARSTGSERAVPLHISRLGGLGAFPQHEVQGVVLAVQHGHAFSRMQLVEGFARELAVAGKLAHGIVDVPVGHPVSQATFLKLADDAQHLRHVIGGAGLVRGSLDAQRIRVLVQGFDHAVGQGPNGLAVVKGALDDLVVNVGDVAHVGHPKAAGTQPALHHIKRHHGAGMTQVTEVIDRHAADVHAHMTGFERNKRLQRTRERVVNA